MRQVRVAAGSRIRATSGAVEYVCLSQPGVDSCGGLGIPGAPLEELVESLVLRSLDTTSITDVTDEADSDSARDLAALDTRADEYAWMAATAEITSPTFARMTAALDTERARLMTSTAAGALSNVGAGWTRGRSSTTRTR